MSAPDDGSREEALDDDAAVDSYVRFYFDGGLATEGPTPSTGEQGANPNETDEDERFFAYMRRHFGACP